jgi:2-oxoglutarate/2-oxoacid ferredoxin oxidoreductase subunit beta
MSTIDDYRNNVEIQWCPGCPNFGILQAFKKALVELNRAPHEVCMVSGIGQAAKLPHYLRCNFFNGLHGRTLPVALGVHVTNPKLTTIVVTGDGDFYGEGGNHFLHTLRRNPDITVVVHNNEIYALTKGQASPTTPRGERRTLQGKGVELAPLNPLAVAILHGCGFVARGFAGDVEHLKGLLVEAISYQGFSYVDVIQPCITWGTHPVSWYRERISKIENDYDPGNREAALEKSMERGEKMPIGIIYKTGPTEIFASRFRKAITDRPLPDLQPPGKEEMLELLSGFRAAEEFS